MCGVMRVSRWVNYAMVYLGSLLMVYNIYCFIRDPNGIFVEFMENPYFED